MLYGFTPHMHFSFPIFSARWCWPSTLHNIHYKIRSGLENHVMEMSNFGVPHIMCQERFSAKFSLAWLFRREDKRHLLRRLAAH